MTTRFLNISRSCLRVSSLARSPVALSTSTVSGRVGLAPCCWRHFSSAENKALPDSASASAAAAAAANKKTKGGGGGTFRTRLTSFLLGVLTTGSIGTYLFYWNFIDISDEVDKKILQAFYPNLFVFFFSCVCLF